MVVTYEKTEDILLIGRNQHKLITFRIGDRDVGPKPTLKYLEVVFDRGLTFLPYLRSMAMKATSTTNALRKLFPRKD